MKMEPVKKEGKWEELLLSLRRIQTNLREIVPISVVPRQRPRFELLVDQLSDLIMVVHRLFEKLEKAAEKK